MKTAEIPLGVSNRHIHLAATDMEALFGAGYQLKVKRMLCQSGEFAAAESLTLLGPRGRIDRVRIVGPLRTETQVEITPNDAHKLGIDPMVRASGDLDGSPGLKLIGPAGELDLSQGAVVSHRHIHMSPQEAQRLGLRNKDHVMVRARGVRGVIFENVLVRVHDSFVLEMHLDTDEANGALVHSGDCLELLLPERTGEQVAITMYPEGVLASVSEAGSQAEG